MDSGGVFDGLRSAGSGTGRPLSGLHLQGVHLEMYEICMKSMYNYEKVLVHLRGADRVWLSRDRVSHGRGQSVVWAVPDQERLLDRLRPPGRQYARLQILSREHTLYCTGVGYMFMFLFMRIGWQGCANNHACARYADYTLFLLRINKDFIRVVNIVREYILVRV